MDNADGGVLLALKGVLGEAALREYKDSGRCFAFGLPTAAGFHACRALEAVITNYCAFFGLDDPNKFKTWGEYIAWLKELRNNAAIPDDKKPSEKTLEYLISFLQPMKDHDRNMLMHVRTVYTEFEAEIMFGMAKSIMLLMAADMERDTPSQLELIEEVGQAAE